MTILQTTDALNAFCDRAQRQAYVTVDTEFLRERTYYAQLCVVQLALPPAMAGAETDAGEAVLVDALADRIDLAPLYRLFRDRSVVKVFHACRQDLEIFYTQGGVIPEPLFDTQVAAMVCGFGEQAGYETLVRGICKTGLDKSSRFTDWARRPLTAAQEAYALADVTHLRRIYEVLSDRLDETGRQAWVAEEMAILTDPATYVTVPADAWRRIKTRTQSAEFLTVLRELARFRETLAQQRNVPRNRIAKDDALLEVASARPKTHADLARLRLLQGEARKGPVADGLLAAVAAARDCPPEDQVAVTREGNRPASDPALADLLRVLLKARAEATHVAQKLIASAAELDAIAAGARDVPALTGWRYDVFGADALRLCAGEIALTARGGSVSTIELQPPGPVAGAMPGVNRPRGG